MACATPKFRLATRVPGDSKKAPTGSRRYGRLTIGATWCGAGSKGIGLPVLVNRAGSICLICLYTCLVESRATSGEGEVRVRAEQAFYEKEKHFRDHPKDLELAWQFGRACFDLAEVATNSAERAQIADRGIGGCRQALLIHS